MSEPGLSEMSDEEFRAYAAARGIDLGGGGAPRGDGAAGKTVDLDPIKIEGDPRGTPDRLTSGVDQAVRGMTGGLSDYPNAAARWLKSKFADDSMSYDQALAAERGQMEAGADAYPESGPLKFAGAMAGAGKIAKALPAAALPQAAGQGAYGAVQAGEASGWDPVQTATGAAVSGGLGALGGKAMASRVARETAALSPAQAAQRVVGRGAAPAAPPTAWQTAKEAAKEAAEPVRKMAQTGMYSGAIGAGAGSMVGAPGVGGAVGTLTGVASQLPKAVGPVGRAMRTGGAAAAESVGSSGIPQATAAGLAGGIPQGAREALERKMSSKAAKSQHEKVQQAYMSGRMSPQLKQELQPAIEAGSFDQLATKLRALAADPELSGEVEKWMKGRSQ